MPVMINNWCGEAITVLDTCVGGTPEFKFLLNQKSLLGNYGPITDSQLDPYLAVRREKVGMLVN